MYYFSKHVVDKCYGLHRFLREFWTLWNFPICLWKIRRCWIAVIAWTAQHIRTPTCFRSVLCSTGWRCTYLCNDRGGCRVECQQGQLVSWRWDLTVLIRNWSYLGRAGRDGWMHYRSHLTFLCALSRLCCHGRSVSLFYRVHLSGAVLMAPHVWQSVCPTHSSDWSHSFITSCLGESGRNRNLGLFADRSVWKFTWHGLVCSSDCLSARLLYDDGRQSVFICNGGECFSNLTCASLM